MTLAGSPFEVAYPVKFYSEGDTTKEAFGKHIQEIERIYGLLNVLNADKLSTDVFNNIHNAHVNSSNPHPNLYLTTLKGDLPVNRVSGDWPTSRLSGNLDGSRITGNIGSATIPSSNVVGLNDAISSQIPAPTNDGVQVTSNGAYLYAGDFLLQWGVIRVSPMEPDEKKQFAVNLPQPYKLIYPGQATTYPAYNIRFGGYPSIISSYEIIHSAVSMGLRTQTGNFFEFEATRSGYNGTIDHTFGNTNDYYIYWHTEGIKE